MMREGDVRVNEKNSSYDIDYPDWNRKIGNVFVHPDQTRVKWMRQTHFTYEDSTKTPSIENISSSHRDFSHHKDYLPSKPNIWAAQSSHIPKGDTRENFFQTEAQSTYKANGRQEKSRNSKSTSWLRGTHFDFGRDHSLNPSSTHFHHYQPPKISDYPPHKNGRTENKSSFPNGDPRISSFPTTSHNIDYSQVGNNNDNNHDWKSMKKSEPAQSQTWLRGTHYSLGQEVVDYQTTSSLDFKKPEMIQSISKGSNPNLHISSIPKGDKNSNNYITASNEAYTDKSSIAKNGQQPSQSLHWLRGTHFLLGDTNKTNKQQFGTTTNQDDFSKKKIPSTTFERKRNSHPMKDSIDFKQTSSIPTGNPTQISYETSHSMDYCYPHGYVYNRVKPGDNQKTNFILGSNSDCDKPISETAESFQLELAKDDKSQHINLNRLDNQYSHIPKGDTKQIFPRSLQQESFVNHNHDENYSFVRPAENLHLKPSQIYFGDDIRNYTTESRGNKLLS